MSLNKVIKLEIGPISLSHLLLILSVVELLVISVFVINKPYSVLTDCANKGQVTLKNVTFTCEAKK